jgi:nicotinamidase-related amidase
VCLLTVHHVDMDRSALLVCDMQVVIAADAPATMIDAVRSAIDHAHRAAIPVIYIQVALRPGRAGVHPRNKKLAGLHQLLAEGSPGLGIVPSLAPTPRDFVLTKHRMSSFAGSGLDVLLRSLDVTDLVLCGISTGTAVLATAFAASDLDFGLTVLSDACFNGERTVMHNVLTRELFPTIATVETVALWGDRLQSVAAVTGP